MDPNDTIAFELLSLAMFALGTGAMVTGALSLSVDERPGGFWLMGWAVLLLVGGFYMGESWGWEGASALGMLIDGLFAPLMWMGAESLRRGVSPPWWPLALGFGAGIARVAIAAAHLEVLAFLLAVTVAPIFFAGAARSTWRARGDIRFRRPIAALFAVVCAVELVDAVLDARQGENAVLYAVFTVLGLPLAAMQIASRLDALRVGMTSAQAASDAAERQRDIERSHFHALFDETKELVAEIEADTRIVFVNARVRELFGFEPEDLIGTVAIGYVPEERRLEAEEIWRNLLKQGGFDQPVTFEMPGFGEDRRGVFLEINVVKRSFDGQARYLVLARDVTGRHASEERLEAQLTELEVRIAESRDELRAARLRLADQERLAVVGTLASGIAHQINNPLGAIRAASDFALLDAESPRGPAVMREALARIAEEADRAGRIVKSVLRFARHGSTPKWVDDLVPVVRRSAELCREYVEQRGARLEIRSEEVSLPVLMSPIEIEQLVVNLVRNAAESRERGARVRVSIARHPTAESARIRVEDDGEGIPESSLAEVFDPFFTTRIRDGGSGLGLSVAHGIVEDHGGEIQIVSAPGEGTRVIVDLPLRFSA